LLDVALKTGADVPVCVASHACDMTGVGEGLMPLNLPKLPCVMVNPRVPVPTKDVFAALGLRNGELLVGAADVIESPTWPAGSASVRDVVAVLSMVPKVQEAPALRIRPVIGGVISALGAADGVLLARMSGSGATCFAIFADGPKAHAASEAIRRDPPTWW